MYKRANHEELTTFYMFSSVFLEFFFLDLRTDVVFSCIVEDRHSTPNFQPKKCGLAKDENLWFGLRKVSRKLGEESFVSR